MKIRNIKALCRFEGYILKELIINENSVEIKIDFDGRIKPRCPHCKCLLRRNKTSKGAAMDLPWGEANAVFITYPRVQDRCRNCEAFVTTRPKEIHPTKHVTWRLMKAVSTWIDAAPISAVGDMFSISESTARRYDKEYLASYCPETEFNDLRALLIDEKHLGKHGYVTIVLNADTGELLHFEKGKKKRVLIIFSSSSVKSKKQVLKSLV